MPYVKEDVVNHIAQDTGLTKDESKAALESTLEFIMDANADNEAVKLKGFGSFNPVERKARKGINPNTGEDMQIQSATVPKFKPGKTYKDRVKG